MGAPGYTVLCPEGHLIGSIESDLYWGDPENEDSLWKVLEKLENSKCGECGKLAMYKFCHYDYDRVNDCLSTIKLSYDFKEFKWIVPKDSKIGYRYLSKEQIKELIGCTIMR